MDNNWYPIRSLVKKEFSPQLVNMIGKGSHLLCSLWPAIFDSTHVYGCNGYVAQCPLLVRKLRNHSKSLLIFCHSAMPRKPSLLDRSQWKYSAPSQMRLSPAQCQLLGVEEGKATGICTEFGIHGVWFRARRIPWSSSPKSSTKRSCKISFWGRTWRSWQFKLWCGIPICTARIWQWWKSQWSWFSAKVAISIFTGVALRDQL